MNAMEIILLIIGFVSISLSFFLGKRGNMAEEGKQTEVSTKELWTPKEEQMIKEQIQTILQEESEEIIEQTTDVLNRKSNEKIMEFDEFSSQVLEKITHNHEEVVFMYSMLSEKEKDWKAGAGKATAVEKKITSKVNTTKENETREKKEEKPTVPAEKKEKSKKQSAGLEEKVLMSVEPKSDGVQEQIIKMHKSGKSVLDISRELNIGQGEVKLMITLYGGKA